MPNFPRVLLCILNVGVLIYGLYHIFAAGSLSESSSINECMRDSDGSISGLGIFWSVVAVAGILGAWFEVRALECVYILVILMTAAATLLFCLFIWAILPKKPADKVFYDTSVNGVWLPQYTTIAQKTIGNDRDFAEATACFEKEELCRTMRNLTEDQKDVFVDFGCCVPPNRCGLEQASNGIWVISSHGLNATDAECQRWAQLGTICYDCDSCKAGFLASYQRAWENHTITRLQSVLGLIVVSIVGSYIFMSDHYQWFIQDLSKHGKLVSTNI